MFLHPRTSRQQSSQTTAAARRPQLPAVARILPAMGGQDLLFVYGSLRRGSAAPIQAWLAARAHWCGPAQIRGRLYSLGAYPGLVSAVTGHEWVNGDLYRIQGGRRAWRQLDAHEGIAEHLAMPQEYRRLRRAIRRHDGRHCTAWVYLYNRSRRDRERIRDGDYLRWLRAQKSGPQLIVTARC